jgi:DNA-binding NarL/FixJ family response regulator
MIKVLLVDDQFSFSEVLGYTLEKSGEIQVLGYAANGREALEKCKKQRPDIVLMDLQMPGCDGVEGTALLKEFDSSIKVLILTTFNDDINISSALQKGADAYVLKETGTPELLSAIKNVLRGMGILHGDVMKKLSRILPQTDKEKHFKLIESLNLVERELDVIGYIVDGLSNKEIADKLGYSEGSVKNMVTVILSKTCSKDRTQLAVYAIKNKLI